MARTKLFETLQTEYRRRKPGEGWNKDRRKDYLLRRNFNLTLSEYLNMLEAQDYQCGICGQPFDMVAGVGKRKGNNVPHVDHRHSDGKVRGLLCGNCNMAIGLLGDDPQVVQSAIDYLTKYSALRPMNQGR